MVDINNFIREARDKLGGQYPHVFRQHDIIWFKRGDSVAYILKEMGLVSSLNVGEDSFRYDANMEPHIHMICQECNEVTDLFGMDLSALNAAAEEKSGYQVVEHQVYLYGSCAECIRRRAN